MTEIQEKLFALQELAYRDFNAKLLPTVERERIIGVRSPALRKLAKELEKTADIGTFMAELPHAYFEEDGLHAAFIEAIRDFDVCLAEIERFLPFIDNWATCDCMKPPVFRKHRAALLPSVRNWLDSEETYTVRFGINMLMSHFLDEDFEPAYLEWVAELRSEEYYVNMMRAWYFATALAKQYEATRPYLQERRLDRWTHNRTIQKAVESYRLDAAQKASLRTLRWRDKEGY